MAAPREQYLNSLKQSITELSALKKKLLNRDLLLKQVPDYEGQSWGGAGAIVISADTKTREQFVHRLGQDAILCTAHAYAIGDLYRKLVKITADDYFTKFEMWGSATGAGQHAVILNKSISLIDLALVIIDEVIRAHELWLGLAVGGGSTRA